MTPRASLPCSKDETKDSEEEEEVEASDRPVKKPSEGTSRLIATLRSFYQVDPTQLAFVPGLRTAVLLMLEWTIWGIGNPTTTAFQLGCLYVGLSDPNGNLSRRLHSMGITLVCVVTVGTLLPGLVWESPLSHFVVAGLVAGATGLSPLMGSPSLFLAMKLATALFAINGAINRRTNGYNGLATGISWTLFGGSMSLVAAILPEIIGNRDALRTDLFQVFFGFGWSLQRWTAHWGTVTVHYFGVSPMPHITIAMSKTQDQIHHDVSMISEARLWSLQLMERAEALRTASLCLSNGYQMATTSGLQKDHHPKIHDFFHALGSTCRGIGLALQFPWIVRYIPPLKRRLQRSVHQVKKAGAALRVQVTRDIEAGNLVDTMTWIPSLLHRLEMETQDAVDQVLDGRTWPPYATVGTLPQRIAAAFPSKLSLQSDPHWAIRGYALRYCFAFTVATIPEVVLGGTRSAHWFPMTVALIMGTTKAATIPAVVHRTLGTFLGIGLGSALLPLFIFPELLIVLLGLTTYGACFFFSASYVWFTCFITAWVFCTTVGVGAGVGVTILYRCLWTLAAAALVTVVTSVCPPKTENQVANRIATMAKAIQAFARAVLEEYQLQCSMIQSCEIEPHNQADDLPKSDHQQEQVQMARERVKLTRKEVICARVAMVKCIHEATLTLSEPTLIDPQSVGLALASDLMDAEVIPQLVSLMVHDTSTALVADVNVSFDELTFSEMDRLVMRLERDESQTIRLKPNDELPETTVEPTIGSQSLFRSAFAMAIAHAHNRLDAIGVPS